MKRLKNFEKLLMKCNQMFSFVCRFALRLRVTNGNKGEIVNHLMRMKTLLKISCTANGLHRIRSKDTNSRNDDSPRGFAIANDSTIIVITETHQ